jgi:predicted nucleotidyltransferase
MAKNLVSLKRQVILNQDLEQNSMEGRNLARFKSLSELRKEELQEYLLTLMEGRSISWKIRGFPNGSKEIRLAIEKLLSAYEGIGPMTCTGGSYLGGLWMIGSDIDGLVVYHRDAPKELRQEIKERFKDIGVNAKNLVWKRVEEYEVARQDYFSHEATDYKLIPRRRLFDLWEKGMFSEQEKALIERLHATAAFEAIYGRTIHYLPPKWEDVPKLKIVTKKEREFLKILKRLALKYYLLNIQPMSGGTVITLNWFDSTYQYVGLPEIKLIHHLIAGIDEAVYALRHFLNRSRYFIDIDGITQYLALDSRTIESNYVYATSILKNMVKQGKGKQVKEILSNLSDTHLSKLLSGVI